MDNMELNQILRSDFENTISYEDFCYKISNNKMVTGYFKIWTKSIKEGEGGLTVQRKGNILLTLVGSTENLMYFTRQMSGEIKARVEEKEIVPIGTTYSCFVDSETKELLEHVLKLYPSIVIKIEVPQFLEGINLTLSKRDDFGKILEGYTYNSFSIRMPYKKLEISQMRAYETSTDIFIPFVSCPEEMTENYKKILAMIKESEKNGREASLSRGSSRMTTTPRANSQIDYTMLKEEIEL